MWPSAYWLYFKGVKGKSVKLRCASVKEAEDWKEALEAESAASVDSSTVPEESSATEVLMKISLGILVILQTWWFGFLCDWLKNFVLLFQPVYTWRGRFRAPGGCYLYCVSSDWLFRFSRVDAIWQCPILTFLPGTKDCSQLFLDSFLKAGHNILLLHLN